MSGDTHELGQVAYEAYGKAVGWTAYDGKQIARWADQDPFRQQAWSAAAEAVRNTTLAGAGVAMLGLVPDQFCDEALTRHRAAGNAAERCPSQLAREVTDCGMVGP